MRFRSIILGVALAACSDAEQHPQLATLTSEQQIEAYQAFFSRRIRETGELLPLGCKRAGLWIDYRGDVRFEAMGRPHHDGLFFELCEEHLTEEQAQCAADFARREDIECCLRGTPLESGDAFDGVCEATS